METIIHTNSTTNPYKHILNRISTVTFRLLNVNGFLMLESPTK